MNTNKIISSAILVIFLLYPFSPDFELNFYYSIKTLFSLSYFIYSFKPNKITKPATPPPLSPDKHKPYSALENLPIKKLDFDLADCLNKTEEDLKKDLLNSEEEPEELPTIYIEVDKPKKPEKKKKIEQKTKGVKEISATYHPSRTKKGELQKKIDEFLDNNKKEFEKKREELKNTYLNIFKTKEYEKITLPSIHIPPKIQSTFSSQGTIKENKNPRESDLGPLKEVKRPGEPEIVSQKESIKPSESVLEPLKVSIKPSESVLEPLKVSIKPSESEPAFNPVENKNILNPKNPASDFNPFPLGEKPLSKSILENQILTTSNRDLPPHMVLPVHKVKPYSTAEPVLKFNEPVQTEKNPFSSSNQEFATPEGKAPALGNFQNILIKKNEASFAGQSSALEGPKLNPFSNIPPVFSSGQPWENTGKNPGNAFASMNNPNFPSQFPGNLSSNPFTGTSSGNPFSHSNSTPNPFAETNYPRNAFNAGYSKNPGFQSNTLSNSSFNVTSSIVPGSNPFISKQNPSFIDSNPAKLKPSFNLSNPSSQFSSAVSNFSSSQNLPSSMTSLHPNTQSIQNPDLSFDQYISIETQIPIQDQSLKSMIEDLLLILNNHYPNMNDLELNDRLDRIRGIFKKASSSKLPILSVNFVYYMTDCYLDYNDDLFILNKVGRFFINICLSLSNIYPSILNCVLYRIQSICDIFITKNVQKIPSHESWQLEDLKRVAQGGSLQDSLSREIKKIERLGILFTILLCCQEKKSDLFSFISNLMPVSRHWLPVLLGVLDCINTQFKDLVIAFKEVMTKQLASMDNIPQICNIIFFNHEITKLKELYKKVYGFI